MWTATLQSPQQQQRALSAQAHRQFLRSGSSESPRSASHPHPTRQNGARSDKARVLQNAESLARREIVPPEQIAQDSQDKQLGHSSPKLQLSDFELMKTLGTGKRCPSPTSGT